MSFYLISANDRRTFAIGAADRRTFRDNCQAAPAEALTDLELVELLDRAKRLPLDDVG